MFYKADLEISARDPAFDQLAFWIVQHEDQTCSIVSVADYFIGLFGLIYPDTADFICFTFHRFGSGAETIQTLVPTFPSSSTREVVNS